MIYSERALPPFSHPMVGPPHGMKIDLIAPALPPRIDGIGDYSACVAAEMARRSDHITRVRVFLPEQKETPLELPGVAHIEQAFSVERPQTFQQIATRIGDSPPDWLLVQYNPFSYGRWGFNPYLPRAVRRLRSGAPGRAPVRVAVMVHEPFVHPTDAQSALMQTWQRWQLWSLARTADAVFSSTAAMGRYFAHWCARAPLRHLPVGSAVPVVGMTKPEARRRLGIDENAFVLGVFGTARNGRLLDFFPRAIATSREAAQGAPIHFVYMGPDGAVIREALPPEVPLTGDGPLAAEEVSRRFAAIDVALAAYDDGVSTRRSGMMAGLAHGVATVGTIGWSTDDLLQREAGKGLMLSPAADVEAFARNVAALANDPDLRRRIGEAGRDLYRRECDWPVIVDRTLQAFAEAKSVGG